MSGLHRLIEHLEDASNPLPIGMGAWESIWDGSHDPVRNAVRAYMDMGWSREQMIGYAQKTIESRELYDACGKTIDHIAEPGDIKCQRCGAELSLEDVVRLTVPAVAQATAEVMQITQDIAGIFKVPPEMLGLPPGMQRDGLILNALDAKAVDEIKCTYGYHEIDEKTKICQRCGGVIDTNPIILDLNKLDETDPEPDTYAVVELPWEWWGLVNLATDTVVVKVHGPGAKEDIIERWNTKTAVWMAWRERNS